METSPSPQRRSNFAWLLFLCACWSRADAHAAGTFAPEPETGPPSITADYPGDGDPAAVIGTLKIAGAGEVTLLANRSQGRLVVKAVGTDGAQLGRAESLVGLGATPIFIRSSRGLTRIVVHWKT